KAVVARGAWIEERKWGRVKMVRILGKKPSEIRKAVAAVIAVLLAVLVAIPVVGLPLKVAAVIAAAIAVLKGAEVVLNKVAGAIDSVDNL
ncbi:hypothetical protein RA985_21340, partial [Mycobacteroides abscessus subsp. abscessus]